MLASLPSQSINATARFSASKVLAIGLFTTLGLAATPQAYAGPSEASAAVVMLPIASVAYVASAASVGAGAVSAVPLALLGAGAVLTVKAVEASAHGTVYVLERASDGARYSVEVAGKGVRTVGASAGTAVSVAVLGTGLLLMAAGEVLAFVPNAIGRALLHNERVTS